MAATFRVMESQRPNRPQSMLTVRAVKRISSPDPCKRNAGFTARAGLAALLKDVAAMEGFALAPEEVALGPAQGDPLGQHGLDRGMQAS